MTEVLQVTVEREYYRKYVLDDAQNADEWPDDLHEVTVHPDELTIEGTPEAIRWLYDWMEWAADAYRLEDGRVYAEACEDLAEVLWDGLAEDPPERQRPRQRLR